MAGSYNDAPSRRMAWDTDGSVAFYLRSDGSAVGVEASAGNRTNGNDESQNYWTLLTNVTKYGVVVFPELRELDGIFVAVSEAAVYPTAVDSSADTTNGVDGTWTNRIADLSNHTSVLADYRDNITSMAVPTEKAIRVLFGSTSNANGARAFHLYGTISPAETPDRILFLDTGASDAVFTKPLDFGDVPRGQTATGEFKIKNNSSGLTINTIQVTAEDLYLNAGDWYEFGDDAVNYQATFAVGNLGPGATKLLYYKQIIPDAETLGVQAGRIKVSHASLS